MGESIAEELVQLLRGLNVSLTLKLSHLLGLLFRYKNASSVGAAAGLAIALVCTWKYLKVPNRQRDPHKREGVPTSADAAPMDLDAGGSSTAVSRSITQATHRSSIIEAPAPAQLTLAQMVRRQLNGGRKVTCQLLGVILEETSTEELQKHAVVRPAVVEVLLEIARTCDLYLVARVEDDAGEASVLAALDSVGVFSVGGLNRNKVLFCSTEAGRSSFVRQLEPDWHVDTLRDIIAALAPFIRHQLHVTPVVTAAIASNVFGAESLERFFGCPSGS